MKKIVPLLMLLFFVLESAGTAEAKSVDSHADQVTAIYFSSPTCGSCQELKPFFEELKSRYGNLRLLEYSIADLRNKRLLDSYCEAYRVPKDDAGMVPAVFIRSRYLTGDREIKQFVETVIREENSAETPILTADRETASSNRDAFLNYKQMATLGAGIVNGLSPCSMSMLLMFLSLLMCRKSLVLKAGLFYCIGKFISYMLLGTVLFQFLEVLPIARFRTATKFLMLAVLLTLILFNISDCLAAAKEQYQRVRLQLPRGLKKLNHGLIRRVSSITNEKLLALMSFALGVFISMGEFMCTGQIYLTTIVTSVQIGGEFTSKALLYLFLYNVGFILPTLGITLAVYKGKEIFSVSETIRGKLPAIKMINAGVLLLFSVITAAYF